MHSFTISCLVVLYRHAQRPFFFIQSTYIVLCFSLKSICIGNYSCNLSTGLTKLHQGCTEISQVMLKKLHEYQTMLNTSSKYTLQKKGERETDTELCVHMAQDFPSHSEAHPTNT